MGAIKQVRLCGFGGQGIVLAGTILGRAAFNDGKRVAVTSSYGAAARGGSCRAEVIISDTPIRFPYVMEADILVALYQSAYDKYIGAVKRDGLVVYDERYVSPDENKGLKHISVPATMTAIKELNNEIVANVVVLGAVAEITGIVTREALKSAVAQIIPERLRQLNLKALDIGFKLRSR